jgi:REP element-mobilizing transposase RayT
MIAGYHLIWTAYGWWLPNDPRGSRSIEIRSAAIEALGDLHYGPARIQPGGQVIREFYEAATGVLKYPLVKFSPDEVSAIADAFASIIRDRGYTRYGCAIMPEHIHLLIRKHRDKAQAMIEAFQDASRAAVLAKPQVARGENHPVWGGPGWKAYLETTEDMWRTEEYIHRNPPEAGLPAQQWPFVKTYDGWLPGQVRIVQRPRRAP